MLLLNSRSIATDSSEYYYGTLGVLLRNIRSVTPRRSENYSETFGVFLPNERKFLGEVTCCQTDRYVIPRYKSAKIYANDLPWIFETFR